MRSRYQRVAPTAAISISIAALVIAMSGVAGAGPRTPKISLKPRPFGVLQLNRKKQFPASVIPKVRAARSADRLDGATREDLTESCNAESVDIGTYCINSNPQPVLNEDAGRNNYFFATQRCAELGGYLPTADQLIGAAPRIKLAGRLDDSELTASTDVDPSDGSRDRREMSSTLVTTSAGSSAAGSQGTSDGAKGDPKTGEPDPSPQPANPSPDTLQYVTVYDNGDKGGFAGSRPVTQPENFRCGFDKLQGAPAEAEG